METNNLVRFLVILVITYYFSSQTQVSALKTLDLTGLNPLYVGAVSSLGDSLQSATISSSAGDLNGDGHEDIVIGAYQAQDNLIQTGLAYVIFGTGTGIPNVDFNSLTSSQGIRIRGGPNGGALGSSVESLGDVNADGIDDIGIGSFGIGTVYIIFGRKTGFSDIDVSNLSSSQGIKIIGGIGGYFGYMLKNVGDVNSDGVNDFIISAPLEPQSGIDYAGVVYVIFGQSNGLSSMDSNDLASLSITGRGFRILGGTIISYIGMSLNKAGDINKDGIVDLMIGTITVNCTSGAPRCGAVVVIYGSRSNVISDLEIDSLNLSRGFKIIGAQEEVSIGNINTIGPAGDVNNDGVDDIVLGVSNSRDSLSHENAGMAYIIYGKQGGFLNHIDLVHFPSSQGFTMKGNATDAYLGLSVASGDIDGDGLNDLLIGSPGVDSPSGPGAGIIYVIFGGQNIISNIDLADKNSLPLKMFAFYGEAPGVISYTGIILNIAKDLNGDGNNDIITIGVNKVYAIYSSKCDSGTSCTSLSPLCYAARGCSCGDTGLFLQDGVCTSQCSQGYYMNDSICQRKNYYF